MSCLLLILLLGAALRPVQARCVDEDRFERADQPDSSAAAAPDKSTAAGAAVAPMPRVGLQQLVRDAVQRNPGLGAAQLLAEAALQDVDEARASKRLQGSLSAAVSPALQAGSGSSGIDGQLQLRAGVSLSQVLFDGGRNDRMVDWRAQQAEAARFGQLSTREQLTLSTVSLALERSRFRMQAVVYAQYVRKMGCLAEALETIISADKGRMSEMVQTRKQVQQAELQQVQAVSSARQVEIKLRRLVGDGLPGVQGLGSVLLAVPDLAAVSAAAERSVDIAQLDANAAALHEMARMVEAGGKPQLSWNVGGSTSLGLASTGGSSHGASVNAGLTVSIPLLNSGIQHSTQAAKKRAEAARLQRTDALQTRLARVAESHEQAVSALDRAQRLGKVMRDSEQVRNFTLQQWQQMGRRSLFDVIGAESDHYNLRVSYVNALHDAEQMNATLHSLGQGLWDWLQ